jgi:hypothetical protein
MILIRILIGAVLLLLNNQLLSVLCHTKFTWRGGSGSWHDASKWHEAQAPGIVSSLDSYEDVNNDISVIISNISRRDILLIDDSKIILSSLQVNIEGSIAFAGASNVIIKHFFLFSDGIFNGKAALTTSHPMVTSLGISTLSNSLPGNKQHFRHLTFSQKVGSLTWEGSRVLLDNSTFIIQKDSSFIVNCTTHSRSSSNSNGYGNGNFFGNDFFLSKI